MYVCVCVCVCICVCVCVCVCAVSRRMSWFLSLVEIVFLLECWGMSI